MRKIVTCAVIAAAFAASGTGAIARKPSHQDILGTWCTEAGVIIFTRNTMAVTLRSGTQHSWRVSSYVFSDDLVKVNWLKDGKETVTYYTEFSADGQSMAQRSSASGPRRELRRC